jgi:hypothetical protein
MTIAHFSAADQQGIGSGLEGLQDMEDVHLAGAQ